jgi:hypothetical protein
MCHPEKGIAPCLPAAIVMVALAFALAFAMLASAGCRRRAAAPAGSAPEAAESADSGRFPHGSHSEQRCVACHALGSVLKGEPAIPGAADHAPCDRGACHQAAFLAAPGPLCGLCHTSVEPTRPGASPLLPYPPRRGRRALASSFSHQKHLDYESMERQVGFHVDCRDCHAIDPRGVPGQLSHAVCGRCHAPESALPGTPSMESCESCHKARALAPSRRRRFITGDLHFRHNNHQIDRSGQAIGCIECHSGSPGTGSVTAHPPPSTQTCVSCHDDSDRTPPAMRMRVCETCHLTKARTFGTLAPRSHLPRLERPEDHTLAFRRDHGADARQNAKRCARCHTFMSGSPRDVCDECHQVMQPHDHVVSWREYDHGPASTAQSERCATCHTGTFCATCHSRLPRSHLPLGDFRDRGHGLPAQLNIRACITCHDPQTMCSACHTVPGAR